MSNDITKAQMQFIVEKLLDNAADIQAQRKEYGKSDFSDGQLSATYAMLDTMRNQLIIDGYDLSEFGLNIDLESALA